MIEEKCDYLILYYKKENNEEIDIIKSNYYKIVNLINKLWGLNQPGVINIYISKSYIKFLLSAFTSYKKIFMGLTLPLWYLKVKKALEHSNALSAKRNDNYSIYIKPINEHNQSNFSLKTDLFKKEKALTVKFISALCHAIVHVFISPINTYIWFREGLGIYTANKLIKKETVKNDSLNILKRKKITPIRKENLIDIDDENLVYNSVKGYWTVRYLEENYPGFLKDTFRKKDLDIEKEIAKKTGISIEKNKFWHELDKLLYNYYRI